MNSMKSVRRRDFLRTAACSTAAIGLVQSVPQVLLRAAENDRARRQDNILVVVQLTGGNDGLNTVVPYSDDEYYKNRYSLGIGRNQVLKINDRVSLNPAMRGFSELLDDGQLTVIQGVGYPNPNRSHFESMDLWHTAHREQSPIPVGWLGSGLQQRAESNNLGGIHLGSEDQPLALAARDRQFPSIRSLESFRFGFSENKELGKAIQQVVSAKSASTSADDGLLTFLQSSTESALQTSHDVEHVLGNYKTSQDYPNLPLGKKLKTVAQMIGAGLETSVYYVALDGFDTHANQQQAHNGLIGQVSDAITAFVRDMQDQGNARRVTTMVFSEFGRRVKQNASSGTDHGAAAPMFLAGGRVQGKAVRDGVVGKHPRLDDLDDGDLKFAIDYRSVYASILHQWLDLDAAPVLGGKFKQLELFS